MKQKSISFCQGKKNKAKLRHNRRELISPNVDPNLIHKNEVLVRQSLGEAYNTVFGEAVAAYNDKQKRKDRRIDDYFEKLFGCKADDMKADVVLIADNKQCSFFEDIVQVGKHGDSGIGHEDEELVTQCLREFWYGNAELGILPFQERNPNFYIFDAVIHRDEPKGTPHIHIDGIPFADGYKTGLSRQNSQSKALEAMGFGNHKDSLNLWRIRERAILEEIINAHGIEKTPEKPSRGSFKTAEYGRLMDDVHAEVDVEKERLTAELESIQTKCNAAHEQFQKWDSRQSSLKSQIAILERSREYALDEITKEVKAEKQQERREKSQERSQAVAAAIAMPFNKIKESSSRRKALKAEKEIEAERNKPVDYSQVTHIIDPQGNYLDISGMHYDDRERCVLHNQRMIERKAEQDRVARLKKENEPAKTELPKSTFIPVDYSQSRGGRKM